jgi:hypothetical protein
VDVAGDSGVFGDGEGADELQHGAVITWLWSPSSFASCREGGERLEMMGHRCASGKRRGARLAADQGKKKHQRDAPCQGKRSERRRGARSHRRRQIRPEELAEMAESDVQFPCVEDELAIEKKGGEGGEVGAL